MVWHHDFGSSVGKNNILPFKEDQTDRYDTIDGFLFIVFNSIYGQFVVYLTVSANCWQCVGLSLLADRLLTAEYGSHCSLLPPRDSFYSA